MITYAYKSWFDQPSLQKDYIITDGTVSVENGSLVYSDYEIRITNSEIADDITIKQYLCSDKQLVYGSCEASSLTLTVYAYVKSLKNKVLNVYMYLDGVPDTLLRIGVFKVYSDKYNDSRETRKITAYDALGFLENVSVSDWYEEFFEEVEESTLFDFRTSFFEHISIVPIPMELPNDSMPVRKTLDMGDDVKAIDVLMDICEINGAFGHINSSGFFTFKYLDSNLDKILYPAESLFPSEDLYPQDPYDNMSTFVTGDYYAVNWESYMAASADIVCLADENTAIACSYPEDTDGNVLLINDNMFVYDLTYEEMETVAANIHAKVKDRYYVPIELEMPGRPYIEVGDPLFISTPEGDGVYTYVLERSLEGTIALTDTIESKGREEYEDNTGGRSRETKKLNNKLLKIKKEVDEVSVELNEQLDGDNPDSLVSKVSKVSIKTDEISTEVSKKVGEDEIISKINQTAESISISASKINLNGYVSFNQGFAIDYSGNAILRNANITNSYYDSSGSLVRQLEIGMDKLSWTGTFPPLTVGYIVSENSMGMSCGSASSLRGLYDNTGIVLTYRNANWFTADSSNKKVSISGTLSVNGATVITSSNIGNYQAGSAASFYGGGNVTYNNSITFWSSDGYTGKVLDYDAVVSLLSLLE